MRKTLAPIFAIALAGCYQSTFPSPGGDVLDALADTALDVADATMDAATDAGFDVADAGFDAADAAMDTPGETADAHADVADASVDADTDDADTTVEATDPAIEPDPDCVEGVCSAVYEVPPASPCTGEYGRGGTITAVGCATVSVESMFEDHTDPGWQVVEASSDDWGFEITWDDADAGDCDLDLACSTRWTAVMEGGELIVTVTQAIVGHSANNDLFCGYAVTGHAPVLLECFGDVHLVDFDTQVYTYPCVP